MVEMMTKLPISPYRALYDVDGDVMYLSEGAPRPAFMQDASDGLLWRIAIDTKDLCGLTIEDFIYTWRRDYCKLAERLSTPLSLNKHQSVRLAKSLFALAFIAKRRARASRLS